MSLFVVKRGFRLPEKRIELEQNMLYVERQLEQYLHVHESVSTTSSSTTGEALLDGGVETLDFVPGYADADGLSYPFFNDADGNQYDPANSAYITQADVTNSANPPYVVSEANPHSGSQHLRRVRSGQIGAIRQILWVGNMVMPQTAGIQTWNPVAFDVRGIPDEDVAYETAVWCYMSNAGSTGQGWGLRTIRESYDINGTLLSSAVSTGSLNFAVGRYFRYISSGTWPKDTAYLKIGFEIESPAGASYTGDLDDLSVILPQVVDTSTLSTRQVGFRFPRRDFNNESAKMENARYLQTQLELYLHEHVEAEEEGGAHL